MVDHTFIYTGAVRKIRDLVRSGAIGEVKKVTAFVGRHNKTGPGPGWKSMPVPDGFDYKLWQGPAPVAPYHEDRCLYNFRFNYDYAGGQVTTAVKSKPNWTADLKYEPLFGIRGFPFLVSPFINLKYNIQYYDY